MNNDIYNKYCLMYNTKKNVSKESPPPPVFHIKTDPVSAHVHFADTGSADNKT